LEGRSRHQIVPAAWLSAAAACVGLEPDALHWMERAVADRDPLALWPGRLPFWDAVKAHPRFQALMREVFEAS